MRIVFDIAAVWRGGAERETLEVASGLSDLGHDVLLIVHKHAEYFMEYADRVPIVELGHMNRWDLRVLPGIRRTLRAFDPDVCVCVMFNASLWGRLAAASLECPVVVAEHSMTGTTQFAERLTNLLLRGVTETVIACADAQVDTLVRAGHQKRKIRVVRNGVDVARFSRDGEGARKVRAELSLPPDAAVLMLVAAHRPEKRHDRFVSLVERLHATGMRVYGVMVGGGPLLGHNRALAEASPVSDWLRVTGPVVDMPAAYSAADLVLLLSDDIETFPLSFLEAQACEVPVVGMDTGGVRETLIDGQTGFVVEQGDLQGMTSVIATLIADPSRRMQIGRTGRRFVEDQLSTNATLKGYLDILERRPD
ncbi:MAG: glycosyltransferase family 4 protein [Candidatus Eisenbacteria bacterium]|nr:glycosyltransferase family 4 protein [Candidatus Eisenbacteria bacterium]